HPDDPEAEETRLRQGPHGHGRLPRKQRGAGMKAVCPGSFDPVTMGHLDIFARAAAHFEEVVVLVTGNPAKQTGLFSVAERKDLIREVTSDIPNLRVDNWGGLLVDYTSAHEIGALVKGLRSSLDYEYELPMAQ